MVDQILSHARRDHPDECCGGAAARGPAEGPSRWPRSGLPLPRAMVDQTLSHARRDHPDECCGVVAGRDGVATRLFEMTNAERSPTGFVFDSAEWLRVHRSMEDAGEDMLVVYTQDTRTAAPPS